MTRAQNPLSLEYILLGFLNQEPIHGYDLYKKLGEMNGIALVWRVKQSYLYALLDKLEKDGLVTSKTVPGESFLTRKEFKLTDMGKQNFHSWLTSPVKHGREMRQEFLAKLYFSQSAKRDLYQKLIQEQHQVCSEWLSNLKNDLSKQTNEQPYKQVILNYRISQTRAMINWLNDLLDGDKQKS
jgi:PadR family transcriptional regulator, regulatory protein AphA